MLEDASGEEFLEYMQRNVFEALGLANTLADQNAEIIPFRTRFYEIGTDGKIVNAPYVDNSYKWAGGGFISTSEDVARFAYAHLHPGFLKTETLALLKTSQKRLMEKKPVMDWDGEVLLLRVDINGLAIVGVPLEVLLKWLFSPRRN